jgi:arsenate reductase-like glutaredoxin family protein
MDDEQAQVFGVKKNADTRKALRFFAERRVRTHFVDFAVRGPSAGELRRFAQKFGVSALVDRSAPRFADLGLRAAQLGEDRWLAMLVAEPLLIRIPLVRFGSRLSVGPDEATWRSWLS